MQAKHYIFLALMILIPLALFLYSAQKEANRQDQQPQEKVEEESTDITI